MASARRRSDSARVARTDRTLLGDQLERLGDELGLLAGDAGDRPPRLAIDVGHRAGILRARGLERPFVIELLELYADPELDTKPPQLAQRGGAWYLHARPGPR